MEDPSPAFMESRLVNQQAEKTQPENSTPPEDIVRALDGTVSAVKKNPLYFLGLFFVTLAMVLLPIFYFALIAAVGYLVFLHATENASIFGSNTNIRVILIGYFGPLIIGGTVLFFMIKPLFARPPKGPEPNTVDPKNQTLLYSYVKRLSDLLEAPSPKRIDVDCQVNASAGFRRGVVSMIGSDLVLTIGLPLVDGMSLRQLTGVLAHELGHFAQGGGMRLSYIVRRISHWFARVVYERDGFDLSLEEASKEGGSIWVLAVVWAARGCVWLTRRILWLLMMIGNVISCILLRQMEYDADRYEVRVAGSDQFEQTAYRLTMLSVGHQIAMGNLNTFWQEKKLPDSYPSFVTANAEMLDDKSREQIWSDRLSTKSGWLDTHPSDADRIKNALGESTPGLVTMDLPAAVLFADYDGLTGQVTRKAYENMLGSPVSSENLIATKQLLEERKQAAENLDALQRFFHGRTTADAPVFLSVGRIETHLNYDELKTSIESAREKICDAPPEDLLAHSAQLSERLYLSLQLLHSHAVQSAAQEAGIELSIETVDHRVEFLHRLGNKFNEVRKLRTDYESIMNHLSHFEKRKEEPKFHAEIKKMAGDCRTDLQAVKASLSEIVYPYEHAEGKVNCGEFVAPVIPPEQNITGIIHSCEACLDRWYRLHFRVLSDLATAAEQGETLAGFSLLPLPDEEGTKIG